MYWLRRCRCRKWCWSCDVGVGIGDDIYAILLIFYSGEDVGGVGVGVLVLV